MPNLGLCSFLPKIHFCSLSDIKYSFCILKDGKYLTWKWNKQITTNFHFRNSNFALQNLCSHYIHEQCSSHRLKCQKAWVNFVVNWLWSGLWLSYGTSLHLGILILAVYQPFYLHLPVGKWDQTLVSSLILIWWHVMLSLYEFMKQLEWVLQS